MKSFVSAMMMALSVGTAVAQEAELKRPRDGYLQASPIDEDSAKTIIAAIDSYRTILASKDYKRFYRECVHSALKQRVSEEQFEAQITTVPAILGKFFDDILKAYSAKGSKDDGFQIGTLPSALVPGSLMIQFADRIDAEPQERWPKGAPLRIQIADDDGSLRFYDID